MWIPAPSAGQAVEFSLYFVAAGTAGVWNATQRVVGERVLRTHGRVVVLAETRDAPLDYLSGVEQVLRDNTFPIEDATATGAFLWITQSPGALEIPIINDLPPPFVSIPMATIIAPIQ